MVARSPLGAVGSLANVLRTPIKCVPNVNPVLAVNPAEGFKPRPSSLSWPRGLWARQLEYGVRHTLDGPRLSGVSDVFATASRRIPGVRFLLATLEPLPSIRFRSESSGLSSAFNPDLSLSTSAVG